MKIQEQWKPVPVEPYGEVYSVSNLGRVRREAGTPGCKHGRKIKLCSGRSDYPQVCLSRRNKRETLVVHRMVAEAFLPPGRDDQIQVNHKDGNRWNNQSGNLEWVTPSENAMHSVRVLEKGKGELVGTSKLTWADVSTIRDRIRQGEKSGAIASEFEVSKSLIDQAAVGDSWKHPPTGVRVSGPVVFGYNPLRAGAVKLDWSRVFEIREKHRRGETQTQLGADYNVSRATIGQIVNHKTWREDAVKQLAT